jgi:hypothetical protein
VTSGPDVLRDGTIRRQEPLGLSWRCAPLHPPLALAGGLVRIVRAGIPVPVWAVFDAGPERSLGRHVALELIGDERPWNVLPSRQPRAKDPCGRSLIATGWHHAIKTMAILIHGAPAIMPLITDRAKDLS